MDAQNNPQPQIQPNPPPQTAAIPQGGMTSQPQPEGSTPSSPQNNMPTNSNKTGFYIIGAVIILVIILVAISLLSYKSILRAALGSNLTGKSVASQFYSDIESNNIQATSPLFDKTFLQVTSFQNLTVLITNLNSRLGSITNYTLIYYNASTNYTAYAYPYAQIVLVYNVTRTKYDSKEKIILYKDNSTAHYLIASYEVRSPGLLVNQTNLTTTIASTTVQSTVQTSQNGSALETIYINESNAARILGAPVQKYVVYNLLNPPANGGVELGDNFITLQALSGNPAQFTSNITNGWITFASASSTGNIGTTFIFIKMNSSSEPGTYLNQFASNPVIGQRIKSGTENGVNFWYGYLGADTFGFLGSKGNYYAEVIVGSNSSTNDYINETALLNVVTSAFPSTQREGITTISSSMITTSVIPNTTIKSNASYSQPSSNGAYHQLSNWPGYYTSNRFACYGEFAAGSAAYYNCINFTLSQNANTTFTIELINYTKTDMQFGCAIDIYNGNYTYSTPVFYGINTGGTAGSPNSTSSIPLVPGQPLTIKNLPCQWGSYTPEQITAGANVVGELWDEVAGTYNESIVAAFSSNTV